MSRTFVSVLEAGNNTSVRFQDSFPKLADKVHEIVVHLIGKKAGLVQVHLVRKLYSRGSRGSSQLPEGLPLCAQDMARIRVQWPAQYHRNTKQSGS